MKGIKEKKKGMAKKMISASEEAYKYMDRRQRARKSGAHVFYKDAPK